MLMSDLRRDYFVTRLTPLTGPNAPRLDELLREIEQTALDQFAREGIGTDRVRFLRLGSLRYENQEHSVEIALPGGTLDEAAVESIAGSFHGSYEREYTYRLDAPVEFVGAHVVAIAEVGKLAPAPLPVTGRSLADALKGRRRVDYATEGVHEADIYAGELLEPGMSFEGPAIVETSGSIIVVHPGNKAEVDDYGNVIVHIALNGDAER
jgi:N-methylhydantoinase A